VFSNIILNAYQAMEGKGTLTIGSKWEGQTILIDFTDTGPGIPPEEIDKIFAPFYTTKPEGKGTGLGLYICRDIVRQLGGDIHVFSSKQGTTFRVEIPVSRNEN
jgi:signal transduction histidine kinase